MKKKIAIIAIIIIIIGAIAGMIYASSVLNKKETEKEKHLIEITLDELEEKISNKESFILVITATYCSHCAEYKPILSEVLTEYDIVAYYIEQDKLDKETELPKLKEIANISGTPATIFIKNGAEESTSTRLSGNQPKSKIISRLKTMGYIKE